MPKLVKFILAIFLLPVCFGAVKALWLALRASGGADTTWVPLLAGVVCWLVVYLMLPKPMLVYVFGHELTHAVWTWIFGGQVKRFKVTSKGGHVVVTKDNFVITLAPYFFPLYAVLLVLIYLPGHLIWGWHAYSAWFHLFLGAAYSFHVTLTFHILRTRQSDVTSQGYLFSAVVIFLGNMLVLLVAVPLLGNVSILLTFRHWFQATLDVLQRLRAFF